MLCNIQHAIDIPTSPLRFFLLNVAKRIKQLIPLFFKSTREAQPSMRRTASMAAVHSGYVHKLASAFTL